MIYSMIVLSATAPSILYRANLYPIGLKRKSMLLSKLVDEEKKAPE